MDYQYNMRTGIQLTSISLFIIIIIIMRVRIVGWASRGPRTDMAAVGGQKSVYDYVIGLFQPALLF
jgi:hypothetical protein